MGQLYLDHDPPYLALDPAHEKNRQGNSISLRADLADDLRQWLAEKAQACHAGDARQQNQTGTQQLRAHECRPLDWQGLPPDTPVLKVPTSLLRTLDRDLQAAGIPKRDSRRWVVHVHAMRTTCGTRLSKAGVAPRTAQAVMRHSTVELTMNLYTDPLLLDTSGAVESLPDLPLTVDERHLGRYHERCRDSRHRHR